jgi:2-polyprenyl-6-methoxyphenol hydroxylase-like FAD-dependent oxidoreductase
MSVGEAAQGDDHPGYEGTVASRHQLLRAGERAMKPGHAEIAGAGIAGLAAAAALAQRGWSVTVHERDAEVRAFGAGIFIYENGLRVLEALGALDEAMDGALPIHRRETRDRRNRLVGEVRIDQRRTGRVVTIERQRLLNGLRGAAERAGAEIRTSSAAVGAEPDGRLHFADGSTRRGDLVIGADGVNSRVRDALGLLRVRRKLSEGGIRLLVAARPGDFATDDVVSYEHWAGTRRIVHVPCGADRIYIALGALVRDHAAIAIPVQKPVWAASFPQLAALIERIGTAGRWDHFEIIKLKRWSRGKVAVIGDAAHAQPPNLGQGGGCAMMGALGLAVSLSEHEQVEAALDGWEKRERPIMEHSQRFSTLYGRLTSSPPVIRARLLSLLHRWRWLNEQRLKTALHRPTGAF